MNPSLIDKIATAVLYEGYILYPYRPSVKSQHRWNFGGLYPRAYAEAHKWGDPWSMQVECLMRGSDASLLNIKLRFLHLIDRQVGELTTPIDRWPDDGEPPFKHTDVLKIGNRQFVAWQEAVERDVMIAGISLPRIVQHPRRHEFSFSAGRHLEPLANEQQSVVGVLVREQQEIHGSAEVSAAPIGDGTYRIRLRVWNPTPVAQPGQLSRDEGLMRSLLSMHAVLEVREGQFISLTDPPESLKAQTEKLQNIGAWPVLVGDVGATDAMLASPIILGDYPQIAPESPGDLFDGTEIDEILTLRVLTLTDEEKRNVASMDPRADAMLKRTESLARETMMGLHGAVRGLRPLPGDDTRRLPPGDVLPAWDVLQDKPKLPRISTGGVDLFPGDRVRLRPRRGGADAFDLLLAGKIATIAAIEQDYEDRIHLAVTIDDDPGADLGMQGKPGHRFFFNLDEVEPLGVESQARP